MARDDSELSDLSLDQLFNLWPGPVKGELTRRAKRHGMTRSEYIRYVILNVTEGSQRPRPEQKKKKRMTVVFATAGERLTGECSDWLRADKDYPQYGLLSAAEVKTLQRIKQAGKKFLDLPGEERRLIKDLRNYAEDLREQGFA